MTRNNNNRNNQPQAQRQPSIEELYADADKAQTPQQAMSALGRLKAPLRDAGRLDELKLIEARMAAVKHELPPQSSDRPTAPKAEQKPQPKPAAHKGPQAKAPERPNGSRGDRRKGNRPVATWEGLQKLVASLSTTAPRDRAALFGRIAHGVKTLGDRRQADELYRLARREAQEPGCTSDLVVTVSEDGGSIRKPRRDEGQPNGDRRKRGGHGRRRREQDDTPLKGRRSLANIVRERERNWAEADKFAAQHKEPARKVRVRHAEKPVVALKAMPPRLQRRIEAAHAMRKVSEKKLAASRPHLFTKAGTLRVRPLAAPKRGVTLQSLQQLGTTAEPI